MLTFGVKSRVGHALFALGLFIFTPLASTALAQLEDGNTTSTTGTQFVRPEPPAKPQPPQPPEPPNQPARLEVPPPDQTPPGPPPKFPEVLVLLDTSDSMMSQAPGSSETRLTEASRALKQMLKGMTPRTRIQLWSFNTRLTPLLIPGQYAGQFVEVGQGQNRERLIGLLDGLRTAGGTNMYQAIVKALRLFDNPGNIQLYRSGQRFPVLLVISDGEDGGKTRETLDSVKKAAAKRPLVTVNTIGFRVGRQSRWFETLCQVATSRQGCANAEDSSQLGKMLERFHRAPEN